MATGLHFVRLKAIFYMVTKSLVSTNFKYTGCPRRNLPDFGRVFLMLKYTDITQNTYVQSSTVTGQRSLEL